MLRPTKRWKRRLLAAKRRKRLIAQGNPLRGVELLETRILLASDFAYSAVGDPTGFNLTLTSEALSSQNSRNAVRVRILDDLLLPDRTQA